MPPNLVVDLGQDLFDLFFPARIHVKIFRLSSFVRYFLNQKHAFVVQDVGHSGLRPCSANSSQMALPIPLAPPVITATQPSSLFMLSSFSQEQAPACDSAFSCLQVFVLLVRIHIPVFSVQCSAAIQREVYF
jgi:hypothetical protein